MANELQPKISMKNIHKSFGKNVILNGFSLNVAQGESLVLIGGSGTGKSVTLKTILGLLYPDSGDIFINGINVTKLRGKKRSKINGKIGMLFQNSALFDSLSILDNVSFGLIQGQKIDPKVAHDIAMEKLLQVGLSPDVARQYPSELSGGMRKRVGLARAIATEPEILFFDEPTTGLDPIMAHVIDDLIVDCVQRLGATAITITHDMVSARHIATHIAMLYQGKIIWEGTTKDLDHPKNDIVQQFITGSINGPIPSQTVDPSQTLQI